MCSWLRNCCKARANIASSARVVNLEPANLADIFDDIRRVADTCDAHERAERLDRKFVRACSERPRTIGESDQPRFFHGMGRSAVCSGHWGPELVEIGVARIL